MCPPNAPPYPPQSVRLVRHNPRTRPFLFAAIRALTTVHPPKKLQEVSVGKLFSRNRLQVVKNPLLCSLLTEANKSSKRASHFRGAFEVAQNKGVDYRNKTSIHVANRGSGKSLYINLLSLLSSLNHCKRYTEAPPSLGASVFFIFRESKRSNSRYAETYFLPALFAISSPNL